ERPQRFEELSRCGPSLRGARAQLGDLGQERARPIEDGEALLASARAVEPDQHLARDGLGARVALADLAAHGPIADRAELRGNRRSAARGLGDGRRWTSEHLTPD